MNRHTWARSRATALLLAASAAVALLAAGCNKTASGSSAAGQTAAAVASSGRAAASQYANGQAGQDAKAEARQLADACKAKLGAQGYNAMAPGVPGAKTARHAYWECEKIPQPKVVSWLACLARAYTSAPPKGPQGSAAETARQDAITVGAGKCTATARGITLAATPKASVTAKASPAGSAG